MEAQIRKRRRYLSFRRSVFPDNYRAVDIPLFKDLSAEKKHGVREPQHKENRAGDNGVKRRFGGETQQEQQRGDHNHRGEVGENVETGGGGPQTGIDFLHENHAVGCGAR